MAFKDCFSISLRKAIDNCSHAILTFGCLFLLLFGHVKSGDIGAQFYSGSGNGLLLFTVDGASDIIYVGGINNIYKLSGADLHRIGNPVSIGPQWDNTFCPADPEEDCSEACPPNEDCTKTENQNFPMLLHVDTQYNNLIVCSNIYQGYCELRNLNNLGDSTPIYKYVVSYDPNAPVVALQSMGSQDRQALYIAVSTSYSTNGLHDSSSMVPLLATRNLQNLEYDGASTVLNLTEIAYEQNFEVIYKHSFSHNGKVYFLAMRRDENTHQYMTVISRVCEGDETYKSYMEKEIKCKAGGRHYNKITSATVGDVGQTLFNAFSSKRKLLFGSFIMDASPSKSAICIYVMDGIEDEFNTAFNDCRSGRRSVTIGPQHITSGRCGTGSMLPGSMESCSDTKFPYIYSKTALMMTGLYRISDYVDKEFTTVQMAVAGTNTLLFLGTDNGHLIQVLTVDKTNAIVYEDFTVEENKAIQQMQLRPEGEALYILTESRLHLVHIANCSQFSNCEDCQHDPYCGWCVRDKQCTRQVQCEQDRRSLGWLPREHMCPAVNSFTPSSVPADSTQNVRFNIEVTYIPTEIEPHFYECKLNVSGHIRMASVTIETLGPNSYMISCDAFTTFPELKSGVEAVMMYISVMIDSHDYISVHSPLYDCTRFESCTSCTASDYRCAWCSSDGVCAYEDNIDADTCDPRVYGLQTNMLKTVSPNLIRNHSGPSSCPRIAAIVGNTTDILIPSNVESSVMFKVYNLQESQIPGSKCVFQTHPPHKVDADIRRFHNPDYSAVTCLATTLKYNTNDAYDTIPLVFTTGRQQIVDNPNNLQVKLYKCEYLVTHCGNCLTLDAAYNCGWCNDRCSLQHDCTTGWLPRNGICGDPTITQFSPTSGPIEGGTKITVSGYNLGKQPSDIAVNIGSLLCEVQEENYQPSTQFVCITSETTEQQYEQVISITISGRFNVVTEIPFLYTVPTFINVLPRRGPISGGSLIEIIGEHLDMGSDIQVFMGSSHCVFDNRDQTHIRFFTIRQPAVARHVVTVVIDGGQWDLPDTQKFSFSLDPTISNIIPLNTMVSGGNFLKVNGTNLMSVVEPRFIVRYRDRNVSQLCHLISNSDMSCPVPDLHDLELPSTSGAEGMEIGYGLLMDGVTDLLTLYNTDNAQSTHNSYTPVPLIVYNDPYVYLTETLTDTNPSYHVNYMNNMRLVLKGNYLSTFLRIDGVSITVDGVPCNITDYSADVIFCIPPKSDNVEADRGEAPVVIRLGDNYQNTVGILQYPIVSNSKVPLILGITLGIVLPLILGILLILCCVRRHVMKQKAKKRRRLNIAPDPFLYAADRNRSSNRYEGADGKPLIGPRTGGGGACGGDELRTDEEGILTIKGDPMDYISDQKLRDNMQDVLIPKERITLGDVLGRGHYGCVYAGKMLEEKGDMPMDVAVKTLQGTRCDQDSIELFLKEGIMMKNFKHPHVLELMGVCLAEGEFPMVILPFMKDGDLRTYVKDKSRNFTARQLLNLCQQVAEGMTYLASLNFVHRDLAARNCMVDENKIVKVADFGLSQDLYEKDYYHSSERKRKLPIKWMALESLEDYIFTLKTDVWAFGILMWELLTRGVTPYPDVDVFEIRNFLSTGRRLRQPKYCPDNVYQIMLTCWDENPKTRPSFGDLVNCLELILNPTKAQQPKTEEEEPLYMNIDKSDSIEYLEPTEQHD